MAADLDRSGLPKNPEDPLGVLKLVDPLGEDEGVPFIGKDWEPRRSRTWKTSSVNRS